MSLVIDAQGYSCPQPLMMTMEALAKEKGPLTVLVDGENARESIGRAAKKSGRSFRATTEGRVIRLELGPAVK
ncbi:MAG: sulfurtransferase TusA family protein [Deltaproteobacteria bacterium]|jgi:TusA-related sulfurtransferase|nr:sulfurtransferase TusA family protein [Deltaproteobacteria bacterium]